MLLLLIFTILLIIGIVVSKTSYNFEFLGVITALFSGFGLLICIISIGVVIIYEQNARIQYQNDKEYIESMYNNPYITDTERSKVTDMIINDNNIIQTSQYWYKNPWIGIFYPNLNDLQPFKQKIPTSTTRINIE